jgi:hypothetical protein
LREGNLESFQGVIHKLKNDLLMLGQENLRKDLNFLELSSTLKNIKKTERIFNSLKISSEKTIREIQKEKMGFN